MTEPHRSEPNIDACPEPDFLRELLRGEKTGLERTQLLAHLRHCHKCQAILPGWGETTKLDQLLGSDVNGPRTSDLRTVQGPLGSHSNSETITFQNQPLSRVGQYELLRRIGRGGGGEVYEALHTRLRRKVAIKFLFPQDAGDEFVRRRFLREMESIGQLIHPNIVQANDAGEVDGVLYLAMELVEGVNVETLTHQAGRLRIEDACEIVRQAALGLQHAHEHGLVHRDIKPSNLLISSTGVKIADLGLALLRSSEAVDDRLTGSLVIMGTADYMAPEQVEGARHVDIRADLYSLGCTLFRLLGQRAPFARPENNTVMKKLLAQVHDPVPDISLLRSETPAQLKAILDKLLAKDPRDRFVEPRELAEALTPFSLGADLKQLLASISCERVGHHAADKSTVECSPAIHREVTNQTVTNLVNSGQPATIPQVHHRARQFALAVILLAIVVLVFGRPLIWKNNAEIDQGSVKNQTTQSSTNTSSVELVVPPPVTTTHDPAKAIVLGPIAQRWQTEFGIVPREIVWQGHGGSGTWRLDEDLKSLVLQTERTIRFVKLGDLTKKDLANEIQMSVDCKCQSGTGQFGFFLGFEPVKDDNPRFTRFQAIEVFALNKPLPTRSAVIRRFRGVLDGHTGNVRREPYHDTGVFEADKNREHWNLKIGVGQGRISHITFSERLCTDLCGPDVDCEFGDDEFLGPFGLYAYDASVWFSNPEFR